ncbi:F-box protein At2g16365-like isoform X2 [Andrographis paniculata]|uniref:F-box protein At2g16365-like isoform X2 n=1 Tax=Andrographis paniculata TaxID=175694 RepID=UPI0021E96882|nr:F-box protein At2g16365-like isoform X2 [Andrographis paniculata]
MRNIFHWLVKTLFQRCRSVQKLPTCVQDIETMRICTTVDSVEATPEGFPRISKTTNSLLITKKTDADLSKNLFRKKQLITEMNGKSPRDIHTHSMWPFSSQGNRGVTLQPLCSSSNSGEKIYVEDAKASKASKVTIKNESSADTDTMDMDIFKEENSNSGGNCNPSIKIDAVASQEFGCHQKNTGIPDINLDLPALPASTSSSENAHGSPSRTQSLEIDMVQAEAEQPKRKSNPCMDETDPIMRWVKRLKLRSPSPSSGENSSSEKMGKLLRIVDSGVVSSEPTPPKEVSTPTPTPTPTEIMSDTETTTTLKEKRRLLLSHGWIKRWLQQQKNDECKETATTTKTLSKEGEGIGGEGQREEDIDNKEEEGEEEFPRRRGRRSIAAMALMGKALNGLQSCELQKQGSLTVWNVQGILETKTL